MGRGNPTPRSNPFEYQVRTAEPRPTSYERPAPTAKVYTYPAGVPRSHEHLYEEPLRNTPKKSSSYDSSDRRRREEEKRDEEERQRQREKESKRSAHSKKEKSRDKDRRRGAEEKVRSRGGVGAYVEDDSDDDFRPPPPRSSEKKSSRHRMEEEIRMREEEARAARERAAAAEVPRIKEIPLAPKWDEHKDRAAKYMQASRARGKVGAEDEFVHPGLRRAETFAPTTAAYNVHYAAPPPGQYSEDEAPRRSSARPKEGRRASDTPRAKSSRRSPVVDPYIVSPPSPPPTRKPSLQSYSSAPPAEPEFVRSKPMPSRSKTQDYPRHEAMPPPLPRASTFQSGDRGRDRGGSRLKKEVTSDSESDSPIHPSPRHSHSPPPRRTQTRYVYQDGATVPVQPSSRHRSELHDLNDPYPRDRSESPRGTPIRPPLSRNPGSDPRTRSHSSQYYGAPPVGPEPVIHTVRPKMAPRTDSHRSSSRTVPQFYGEVKYSQGFQNVSYAPDPADLYAHTHHRRGSDERGYYGRSAREIYT